MIADRLIERARRTPRRIAFPESADPRILQAAAVLVEEKIAHPILVGPEAACREAAKRHGMALEGVEVWTPPRRRAPRPTRRGTSKGMGRRA